MSAKITELDENSDPAAGAPGQIFTVFSVQLHAKSTEPHIGDARYKFGYEFRYKTRAVWRGCLLYKYQCPDLQFQNIIARTFRTDRGIISSMRSARVDLVGSRLYFVDFSSGSAVPSEKYAKNHKIFKFLQSSTAEIDERTESLAPCDPRGSIGVSLTVKSTIFRVV